MVVVWEPRLPAHRSEQTALMPWPTVPAVPVYNVMDERRSRSRTFVDPYHLTLEEYGTVAFGTGIMGRCIGFDFVRKCVDLGAWLALVPECYRPDVEQGISSIYYDYFQGRSIRLPRFEQMSRIRAIDSPELMRFIYELREWISWNVLPTRWRKEDAMSEKMSEQWAVLYGPSVEPAKSTCVYGWFGSKTQAETVARSEAENANGHCRYYVAKIACDFIKTTVARRDYA